MKISIGVLLSFLMVACSTMKNANSQEYCAGDNNEQNIKEKDGKCYAKAMMPTTFDEKKEYVAVYTGDKMIEGVEKKTISTKPPTTKWEKKTCTSGNPNDGLVWCLVEVPAESEILNVVTDTSKIKDFVMRPISIRTINDTSGVTKEVEILCPSEETPEMMRLMCSKLVSRGFLQKDEVVNFLDPKIKNAIVTFQKSYGLPQGALNMATMKALGVK